MTVDGELGQLRLANAMLKDEVEQLRRENAELKAKLVKSGEPNTI